MNEQSDTSLDVDADPYTLRREDDGDDAAEAVAHEASPKPDNEDESAHRIFWADAVADAIEAREPEEPIVIKGGVSPSGVPHLGHVNEILRGYLVAEVLRERSHEVRQVFTSDDKDPLRAIPHTLATLAFDRVDLGDADDPGALGRNLGKPLTDVPDPFRGCECDSFGAHQTELLERSAERLGVPIEVVSNTDLYAEGAFETVTRTLLDRRGQTREVLSGYQSKVNDEYVPFNPVCGNCGKITETVKHVDLDGGTVEYVCTDMEAGNKIIEGCGHRGTATLREGKLPWRFEWPAQWKVLEVDFEPFGKDHAEGSWPSGEAIASELLESDPPVPMVYEWFTLGGEAISSSAGNVITVPEVLSMLERPVIKYFFAKDPTRARDFDVSRLDQLVDEFDRLEGVYFGEIDAPERERRRAERIYPLLVEEVREDRYRIPYTFAAVLGMTDDPDLRTELARRQGHLPEEASERAISAALARVDRARTWAARTDNAYNYRLATDRPETDIDTDVEAALDDLADRVASIDASDADAAGESIQSAIFETAREHDLSPGGLFTAGYRLFFDAEQGPQLGPFLAELDRAFVLRRLRREG